MTELKDYPDSDQLKNIVRSKTDKILLSFSGGKDSIAMWLFLRDTFDITPYLLYLVPGLESDAEILAYYEKYFGQKIHVMPHPLLYQYLNSLQFQPPQNVAKIWAMNLPDFTYADVDNVVASQFIGTNNWYCAVGMRARDNLDRRYMIMQTGVLSEGKRRFYYAVWDFTIDQVWEIIRVNKCKVPKAYHYNGRTLTALDYQYLKPLKEHYPKDFDKIREVFPLVDAEFYRWEHLYENH